MRCQENRVSVVEFFQTRSDHFPFVQRRKKKNYASVEIYYFQMRPPL